MIKRLLLISFSMIFSACGNMTSLETTSSSQVAYLCNNCTETHKKIEQSSPTRIVDQNSALQNYRSCLGVEKLDSRTVSLYNQIKNNLSYDGNPESINNTVVISNIKTAIVACSALIEQERNGLERKIFVGFGLNPGDSQQNVDIEIPIKKISSQCWGREINHQELEILRKQMDLLFRGFRRASLESALYICTTLLSTPEAMKQ